MKVTFINPNFTSRKSFDAMQPLVYAILAAHTPPDIEQVFYDERIEEIPFTDPTDLVVLSVQTFTARRAYAIAREYKQRGIPVVMGGLHPTLMPEEALAACDAVAIGEAEEVWPEIIDDARRKKLKPLYRSQPSCKPLITRFDRDIFKGKRYQFLIPVQFGRGCRFHCDFCCIHVFYKNMIRNRPIADLIAEIRALRSSYLFFVDDNLSANYTEFKSLMQQLAGLKKHFACQVSLEAAVNAETVALLKQAGCMAVFIGFESLSADSLKQMGKGVNRNRSYEAVVDRFHAQGIMVIGSFVFGYDHDSPESIRQAYDFALKKRLCLAQFNMIYPFPGTKLYDRLQRDDRLVFEKWWLDEACRYADCLFLPKHMTPEELKTLCQLLRKQFSSFPSLLYRSLNLAANTRTLWNFIAYWASNLVSRKEIKNKLTMELG